MTESLNTEGTLEEEVKNTICYTYEVTMIVQILAPNKEIADAKLDREGGYVSKRDVNFKHSVAIYQETYDPAEVKDMLSKEEE
jgi:hypothetical protein